MRREADFFGEAELDLVYMARRLSDALSLESDLSDAGIDYFVETGSYLGGFLMKRELAGAFFYVSAPDLALTKSVLDRTRRKRYVAD